MNYIDDWIPEIGKGSDQIKKMWTSGTSDGMWQEMGYPMGSIVASGIE